MEVEKMTTRTQQQLIKLYQEVQARKSPNPITLQRPTTIHFGESRVELERIATHLPEARCDRVTVYAPNGTYVLNDMTDASVLFIDGNGDNECSDFQYSIELRKDRPTDHFIFYESLRLGRGSGIYSLLHEFCHIAVNARPRHQSNAHLENAVWDEADKLATEMGLVLFDNETEQRLYRDIRVRTCDPKNEAGIDYRSAVGDIYIDRFPLEVIFGLVYASNKGVDLEPLCDALF